VGFAVGQQWVSAAIMFATGALFAGVSIASIVGDHSMAGIAWSGLFVLVGVGVIAQAAAVAREALRRRREFALACDGLLLVGRDLDEPLPTRGTTFELQNTDGDLFVVLRHRGQEQRLAANHWRPTGGMTLHEALEELSLRPAAGFYAADGDLTRMADPPAEGILDA
jgi:hypothetical protein